MCHRKTENNKGIKRHSKRKWTGCAQRRRFLLRQEDAHPREAGRGRVAQSQSWEGWKMSQQAEDKESTEALRREEAGQWESDYIVLAWQANGFRQ